MRIIPLDDESIGLSGVIAIHSTKRGPAFGGIRIVDYASIDEAQADAENLARAMTYKCVLNGIPGGGGKIALIAGRIKDRRAVMEKIAEVVNELDGEFFAGPDSSLSAEDIAILASLTKFVSTEDISSATAQGIAQAIRATCDHAGLEIKHIHVAIQGLGAVGGRVASTMCDIGARVDGTDVARKQVDPRINQVAPADIFKIDCDLFCPCALGGVIDHHHATRGSWRAIVGAANNPLTHNDLSDILHDRNVLFVPDFVSNAGGLIRGAWGVLRGTPGTESEIDAIYSRVRDLLSESARRNVAPLRLAIARADTLL